MLALENGMKRLERRIVALTGRSDRYSWLRLGIFLTGSAISVAGYYVAGWWLTIALFIAMLIVFNIVAYFHRQITSSLARHRIWLKLKATQLARMKLDWDNIPVERWPSDTRGDHPFETDLDITGERSVHRLLDTAASREGSQRSRDWLLTTVPDLALVRQRQGLVREIAPLSRFRDKLLLATTLASKDLGEQWEGKRLLSWLSRNTTAKNTTLKVNLVILVVLSAFTIVSFGLFQLGVGPALWVISWLAYVLFYFLRASSGATNLFDEAWTLKDGLTKLSAVFKYLETYRYGKHQRLRKLCEPLLDSTNRPSVKLRRVARVAGGATLQKNQILWLIVNVIVPWDLYFAYRLEQCKREIGAVLPGWLEVWFELEALNSLANFSYLNPEYVFPEVAPAPGPVVFSGKELGHPLILDEQKVCNDFSLEQLGDIVIITGSNMAGKSSFLRTLGVNLCLAYAGGAVNAQRLHTSLFRVFTCIKVSDSVTDGYSYFYAEVRRLKALLGALEKTASYPLFFLIDEIFRGTNNRERLIGSRSYLKALAGRNGVGAVSTHDLELIKLADELPQIMNYHFREEVIDGQMIFDYRLRPGPSPTTNALKIMQMEGLPVELPDEAVRQR